MDIRTAVRSHPSVTSVIISFAVLLLLTMTVPAYRELPSGVVTVVTVLIFMAIYAGVMRVVRGREQRAAMSRREKLSHAWFAGAVVVIFTSIILIDLATDTLPRWLDVALSPLFAILVVIVAALTNPWKDQDPA